MRHDASRRDRACSLLIPMSKGERAMLILVAVVFMATVFAVLVAPHVPFLAAGE